VGGGAGSDPVNLLANGDFEAGSGDNFTNWGKWNGGASLTQGTAASEIHGGARSLKVTVAANGNPWSIQMASDLFNTTVDTQYKISFWIKSANAGGVMRVSTGQQHSILLTITFQQNGPKLPGLYPPRTRKHESCLM
jgi:endo-1,4-beta-xylanase